MSDAPDASPRRRREPITWLVLGALALAYLIYRIVDTAGPAALHPAFVDTPDGPHAKVGATLLAEYAGSAPGRSLTLRVPIGTVHLYVSTPTMTVLNGNGDGYRPPRDGSFVEVDTDLDLTTASVPTDTIAQGENEVSLALIADGRRYPFGRPSGGSAIETSTHGDVVAVAGTPQHEQVEVTYRGVRQTVDVGSGKRTTGRAAALYRPLPGGSTDCGRPDVQRPYRLTPATYALTCHLDWRRVPFVPGLGWAPSGRSWLLMSIDTAGPGELTRGGDGPGLSTSPYAGHLTIRCEDGSAAVRAGPPSVVPRERDGQGLRACPSATAATRRLPVTERLMVFGSDGESGANVDVTWSVPVG